MADKNLELALKIRADLQQARREIQQLEDAVEGVDTAAQQTNRSTQGAAGGIGTLSNAAATAARQTATASSATREYDVALNAVERSSRNLQDTTASVGGGMTALAASVKAATLTIAAGFGLAQVTQSADAWTAYENRLRLVTDTQAALAQSSADVYQIARDTSQQLDSTAAVYQRFAQNMDRLNITQRESADLTETVSKAIAISGGSAASAEAALVQFGQALASGVLRGEEFNSVMEQAPALALALANGLNVDIGKLRELANESELTADVLVNALSAAADSVDEQFETRVKTIAQAATEFDTAFTRLVGTLSSGTGAGQEVATIITGLADLLDTLSDNLSIVDAALETALILTAGRVVASLAGMTAEGLKNIAMQKAAATAAAQKALADEGAAVAAKTAAVSELERARAAVTAAEADVAATAAQAKRAASAAAAATGLNSKAAMDARAATAAAAHMAAESRLTAAIETRTVASEVAAVATVAVTRATVASAAAASAASVATSLLTRAIVGLTAVGGRIMAMLGGPLGIIISLGLAATAFIDFGNDAQTGMDRAANATEQASVRIRNASRDIIRDLNIGSVDTASFDQLGVGIDQLESRLNEAKQTRDYIQQLNDTDIPLWDDSLPTLDEANEKVRSLESALAKLRQEQGSGRFEGQRAADEYLESLVEENERLQQLSSREEALNFLREQGVDVTSELGRKILDQVDANEQLAASNDAKAESERQAQQAAEDAIRATEQRANAQRTFVEQLERSAALQGKSANEAREYRLVEQGLTGQLLARARAANAAIEAQERLNQAMADAKQLSRIQSQVLELSGDPVGARSAVLEQQYGQLLSRLEERGDQAGITLVNRMINLDLARTRLSQMQSQIDAALQAQARAEESINIQQDAGLISELEARDRILEIHRQTFGVLQQQRPLLEELAQQPGVVGEQATAALEQLNNQMAQLQATTTLFQSTLKEGLENGIADAIRGLVDGTMTLRDAVAALAQSVADAMLQIVSNGLAEMATRQVMQMFTQTSTAAAAAATTSAGAQVAAIGTVTAAKTASDATMAASAITAANTAAAGTAPAAAATTAQWAPAATTASIGSFGSAAAIGIAAVLAALAMAQAFNTGGHVRGPGTETSDSIPAWLSDNEFVTRAAVVKQPGALSFLSDFNERGMVALDDWASSVRHATGGLAGVPAPAMNAPQIRQPDMTQPQPAGIGSTLKNNVDVFVGMPDEFVLNRTWGRAGRERFYVELQDNAATVRQILGMD